MGKKASGAKSPGGGAGASGTISKKPTGHSMSTVGRGKGSQSVRSAATVRRLMMYKQKPVRDKKGKVLVPLRMIPWDDEFDHIRARVLFNTNKLTLTWILGDPMPENLVADIVGALPRPSPKTHA